jgi:hypothetical protein
MTTYTAYFRTEVDFATRDFETETPGQALALARRFYDDDPSDLMFESYDAGMPVDEIAIHDQKGEELVAWVGHELRLRLAGSDLLKAAELVIARWSKGDLAEAVRQLDAVIAKAKGG